MRVMMKLQKNFQPRHRGLAIEGRKLPVNGRCPQNSARGVEQFAPPQFVGVPRSHPDHRKKRRDEGSAHKAMVRGRVVQVERARHRLPRIEALNLVLLIPAKDGCRIKALMALDPH
jgi:hypothetical protein